MLASQQHQKLSAIATAGSASPDILKHLHEHHSAYISLSLCESGLEFVVQFFLIVLIASAGVNIQPLRSTLLLCLGLMVLALFFVLDSRNAQTRLFPSRLFDWRTPVGTGMTMVAAFSLATCSFGVYGPLLLTTLHGVWLLTTGYIIAAATVS